jgi:hypothetical protein
MPVNGKVLGMAETIVAKRGLNTVEKTRRSTSMTSY